MNEQTNVEWREWGPDAFQRAERASKPILLSLVVGWSPECREMDATTYTEPRIAANINDGFVPIRVDADRHPRIRDRYTMGGFPSTVFLTPAGEVITGATFLGVDGFRGILDTVRETWDAKGESAGSVPRALQGEPPGGELSARVEEHMVEQLLAAFDDEFGGWGSDVKFPLARTIEFALVRARDQATRTLEAVRTHLLDTYDGGFYRYAGNRNWGQPSREKLLDDNAALVRAFAHGYRYTGEDAYREAAAQSIDYLSTTLWTGEAFGTSQASDDRYYRLGATEREDADTPAVDETVLAGHNGLAIDALLTYYGYTDDEDARRYAERARDTVLELVDGDGAVAHFDGADSERGLLLDQGRLLTGLTTAWQVLGEGGPARTIADWTLDNLADEEGRLRDGRPTDAGLLSTPLYPLDYTVETADALLDLSLLTGEDRYREAATAAIESYASAAERMGVEAAHYATVAARLDSPQVVRVGTPAGSDLHRAALRLADHESVVLPDADTAGDDAVLVVDGTEQGRADSPAALEALLTDTE